MTIRESSGIILCPQNRLPEKYFRKIRKKVLTNPRMCGRMLLQRNELIIILRITNICSAMSKAKSEWRSVLWTRRCFWRAVRYAGGRCSGAALIRTSRAGVRNAKTTCRYRLPRKGWCAGLSPDNRIPKCRRDKLDLLRYQDEPGRSMFMQH